MCYQQICDTSSRWAAKARVHRCQRHRFRLVLYVGGCESQWGVRWQGRKCKRPGPHGRQAMPKEREPPPSSTIGTCDFKIDKKLPKTVTNSQLAKDIKDFLAHKKALFARPGGKKWGHSPPCQGGSRTLHHQPFHLMTGNFPAQYKIFSKYNPGTRVPNELQGKNWEK